MRHSRDNYSLESHTPQSKMKKQVSVILLLCVYIGVLGYLSTLIG
jgi:hypothetical protein